MNDFNEITKLYHSGILGMQWGVRRYQNEDGTLTEEGKRRYYKKKDYEREKSATSAEEKISVQRDVTTRIVSKEQSSEANIGREASSALGRISSQIKPNYKTIKKDYSGMSDQELRDKVNRLNLEEQYGRLSGDTKQVKSASDWIRDTLSIIGTVVSVGASALVIASEINKIKSGSVESDK